jgi:ferredoxin
MEESTKVARKVRVDEDTCIGCGTCEGICPEVFQVSEEEGKSQVINPEGGPEDLIQEAIDSCPMEAIHWEE